MKKIIAVLLLLISVGANAQHRHGHHHHYRGGYDWVSPFVVGGVVTYVLTRPSPPPPPQVIYVPQQTNPPLGYRYEQVLDANCSCYRLVLVPN